MSDHDESDASTLERIREEKLAELRERTADEPGDGQTAAAEDEPVHVEDATHLEGVLEREGLVLLDFYADWCGPCQMLAPILERLAGDVPATIAKVDTDAMPQLAQQYGVRGLPTLVLVDGGQTVEQLVGMQDETTLRQVIDRHAS